MISETIREWFPVLLSIGSIIGGYYTLKAKVDEVTRTFANFLEKEYGDFKLKQEKYVQEHYQRIGALEIKAATSEASQAEINRQVREQYVDIKAQLSVIENLLRDKQ